MKYVIIKAREDLKNRLKEFKRELGFKTIQETIKYLILFAEEKKILAVANLRNVMITTGTRPCIITGPSGSGKTTAVKNILRQLNPDTHTIFILDVSNEYGDLAKKISLGEFFSVDWTKNQHLRFVPNSNVEICKAQAATIFSHLNFLKSSGQLKNLIFIVEEAHRFRDDINLRSLMIEARKFLRKMILITTDWRDWEGIAPIFRPPPWNFEVKENDK